MSGVLVAVPAVPLVAALALVVVRSAPAVAARIAIIASAVAFAAAAVTLVAVGVDGPMSAVATGDDGGAIVGLAADRVGAILITLTTLVGLVVQSFASRSLRGDLRAHRFHMLALVLTASTTVVAISATATGFVVGWIATSVVLVALIGHRAPWPPAVAAQRRTGWSFLIGDSVLVVAMVVTLVLVGDIDLRSVGTGAAALDGEQIAGINALTVVATLFVLAGIARSALVPIHRWLPSTLAAPTPVSALLHAGVINGAGVLLIRFSPVFASSATAMAVAFAIGMLTALLATAVMLVRTDVKGGLVWSTAGQMGFMVMQLGVGAFAAALFHIVGHAMYKAAMFLGAGGAISAHQRQQQRPHLGLAAQTTLTSWPVRLLVGLIVPLASFALALVIVDPHLTASATILIVVFGVLSVGRAANGWMGSTPFQVTTTILTATIGIVVGVFAYVGGITVFEHFVVDVVPYDVPAAVGPLWVAATLIGLAIVVAVITLTPGPRGQDLRRRVYVWLVSTGATTTRPVVAPIAPAPRSSASAHSAPAEVATPVTVGDLS
jgi:NADH:ubiquinone oxidoreductase subunit 5 (subunit L)/multisubunit Na+/H+ antiporter MnhA subunit